MAANHIYDRIPVQSSLIKLKKAMNLIAANKYKDSIFLLKQLVAETPQDAYIHLLLGDSYTEIKNHEQAIQSYQKAGKLFKENNSKIIIKGF